MVKQGGLLEATTSQSMFAHIRILRLWAAFALAAAVILSFLAAQEGNVDWGQLAIALAVVLLIGTAVYPLNDVYDLEVDKRAHPNRPLVRGEISTRQAQTQAYLMIGCGVLLSIFLGLLGFTVAVGVAVAVVVYSSIKRRFGLAGNILTAVLCSVALACGVVTNPPTERLFIIVLAGVLLSLLLFSREIVKDIADMDFDTELGKQTLPIQFGAAFSYRVSAVSLLGTGLMAGMICLIIFDWDSIAFLVLIILYLAASTRIWSAGQKEASSHATQLKYVLLLSLVVWSVWVGANVII